MQSYQNIAPPLDPSKPGPRSPGQSPRRTHVEESHERRYIARLEAIVLKYDGFLP